jgi:hypothetical protein
MSGSTAWAKNDVPGRCGSRGLKPSSGFSDWRLACETETRRPGVFLARSAFNSRGRYQICPERSLDSAHEIGGALTSKGPATASPSAPPRDDWGFGPLVLFTRRKRYEKG